MIPLRTFHVIVSVLLGSYTAPTQTPKAQPAIDSIIEAFDNYSIVMLGEVHWNLQQHRFIQGLLRDRRLPGKIDDVAVEFGNSLYQPLIDRHVAGVMSRVIRCSLRGATQRSRLHGTGRSTQAYTTPYVKSIEPFRPQSAFA